METLFDWLIHIPIYVGQFADWLTSPIGNGINWSPLAIIGSSAGVAIVAIIAFHVIHLVNPLG